MCEMDARLCRCVKGQGEGDMTLIDEGERYSSRATGDESRRMVWSGSCLITHSATAGGVKGTARRRLSGAVWPALDLDRPVIDMRLALLCTAIALPSPTQPLSLALTQTPALRFAIARSLV